MTNLRSGHIYHYIYSVIPLGIYASCEGKVPHTVLAHVEVKQFAAPTNRKLLGFCGSCASCITTIDNRQWVFLPVKFL